MELTKLDLEMLRKGIWIWMLELEKRPTNAANENKMKNLEAMEKRLTKSLTRLTDED